MSLMVDKNISGLFGTPCHLCLMLENLLSTHTKRVGKDYIGADGFKLVKIFISLDDMICLFSILSYMLW